MTGRLVDVRAPRLDVARIPKASPASQWEPPGPAVPGSSRPSPTGSGPPRYRRRHRRRPGRPRRRADARSATTCCAAGSRPTAPPASPRTPSTTPYAGSLPRTTTLSAILARVRPGRRGRRPRRGLPASARNAGRADGARRPGGARSQLRARAWPTASTSRSALAHADGCMSTDHVELRTGAYADSVTLLQVSRQVQQLPGVVTAQVAMATPLNVEVLERMRFAIPATPPSTTWSSRSGSRRRRARRGARRGRPALTDSRRAVAGPSEEAPPRTTASALRRDPGALVLVSVPGASAAVEAMDALEAGSDVMIFSDNVPLEQEVALKRYAASRDLLVMGPDCGTAVVDGLGLGFANVVSPGPVGHRRGIRHRLPAGARAPRPCRRRRHHGVRRRRARPVRRRRRARDPHRAGAARRSTPASSTWC